MEIGIVRKVVGDRAFVEFQTGDACNNCGARLLCNPVGDARRQIAARNHINAQIGDSVAVDESELSLIKISLLQYGIPLFMFILAMFLADAVDFKTLLFNNSGILRDIPEELFTFAGGLVGIVIGGSISYAWAMRIAARDTLSFVITHIRS